MLKREKEVLENENNEKNKFFRKNKKNIFSPQKKISRNFFVSRTVIFSFLKNKDYIWRPKTDVVYVDQ